MKKLLVFLCVVVLVFGVIGCKKSSTSDAGNNSVAQIATTGVDTPPSEADTVPEPATILLFGSGLVCLAGIGRKKFFKKDQGKG